MKNTIYSFKPVRVLVMAMLAVQLALNGLSPVRALSTSSLVGWGNNYWGQASIPAGLTDVVAITRAKGGKVLRTEIDRLAPAIRSGGVIPSCDHGIPADVSWPNFVEYCRLLAEVTGWA